MKIRIMVFLASLLCTIGGHAHVIVGFSPEGSAQKLVMNTLNSTHHAINLMGYSFTSPEVVKALIAAKRRGVDVRVVLDSKANQGRASVAAINLLVNAGIEVRTVDNYKIMHDKVAIIDDVTVQTGSFNYTRAAQRSNSENVVVMWQMPEVAQVYLEHWQSRWSQGQAWQSRY